MRLSSLPNKYRYGPNLHWHCCQMSSDMGLQLDLLTNVACCVKLLVMVMTAGRCGSMGCTALLGTCKWFHASSAPEVPHKMCMMLALDPCAGHVSSCRLAHQRFECRSPADALTPVRRLLGSANSKREVCQQAKPAWGTA